MYKLGQMHPRVTVKEREVCAPRGATRECYATVSSMCQILSGAEGTRPRQGLLQTQKAPDAQWAEYGFLLPLIPQQGASLSRLMETSQPMGDFWRPSGSGV